jgi:chemotaxis protein methyltransferase CheR
VSKLEVRGIPELSVETFERFRELIYREMGIYMRDSKKILVANRLRKRVTALGLASYEEYYRLLTGKEDAQEELNHFMDSISTNETYFYRGDNQFAALQNLVLPNLFKIKKRLNIWSAGSSSGEEPYTIFMVIDETARSCGWQGEVLVVATDINRQVIKSAREGEYGGRALRVLPRRYIEGYFERLEQDRYRVKNEVKRHIRFQVHNLLKDQPPGDRFDIIFCRNVLIYFDRPTQRRIIDDRFASVLAPDGYLFIGNSESLLGDSERFLYARLLKSPIYRLKDGNVEGGSR